MGVVVDGVETCNILECDLVLLNWLMRIGCLVGGERVVDCAVIELQLH